jgi:formylglycine-generating enzyme required for sulfatase activity
MTLIKKFGGTRPELPKNGREGRARIGASNGGVWEWTSTKFAPYPGFSSSILYPGYSSDFFDGMCIVAFGVRGRAC